MQYAPWYLARRERREFSDYAGSLGIGLKHNRLLPDHDDQVIRSDTATIHPDVCRTGQYDPMLQFAGQVPLAWEGTASSYPTTADLLWSLLNGLNKHPAYLLLGRQPLTTADPVGQWALRLADRYAGVSIDTTPGVWVALRETQSTWYPQRGNFDFWLRQVDSAPGGRTVPQWNVTGQPWGRFTRRTDAASGNPDMVFAVDDAYLFDNATRPVTVTVIYLDAGRDTWELQYDAVGDPAKSAGVVTKTNSNQWREAVFTLPDARFSNQLNGYDFRIRSRGDGDEFVSFVEVVAAREGGGRGREGEWRGEITAPTLPLSLSPSLPLSLSRSPSASRPTTTSPTPRRSRCPTRAAWTRRARRWRRMIRLMGCGEGTQLAHGVVSLHRARRWLRHAQHGRQRLRHGAGGLAGRAGQPPQPRLQRRRRLVGRYVQPQRGRDPRSGLPRPGGQPQPTGDANLALRANFNACTYSADLAALQSILATYNLPFYDYFIEVVTTPNNARCAITGLALPGGQLAAAAARDHRRPAQPAEAGPEHARGCPTRCRPAWAI